MLNTTHKAPRRRNVPRRDKSLRIERFRHAAPTSPEMIADRFATAMLSGDTKEMDRILREIAEVSLPPESSKQFFGQLTSLLTRAARRAAKLRTDHEQLRNQALSDELTGLHNRRGFFALAGQQLKLARRNGQHAMLFFVDVNGLKQINDRFGHAEGDAAIERTAGALRRTFRDSDILSRLGGDEFAVLAIEAAPHGQEDILSRLKENLVSEASRDPRYVLSLSVGVARFDPQSPMTLDNLLNHADRAMYQAKRSRGDALCSAAAAGISTPHRMSASAA